MFKLVSDHVTLESLKLILEVLKPKTSKEELMEDEEEEEGEGEGEEEGEGSEVEGEGSEVEGGEDSDSAEEDGDGDTSEGGEGVGGGEEVDPAFRAEVLKALGAAAVDSEAEVCSTEKIL